MVIVKGLPVFFPMNNGSTGRVGSTEGGVAVCTRSRRGEEEIDGEEEEGEESVRLG